MGENLITKVDDTSWQKEFLEMKSHSTSDVRLLMQGAKGFRDAWHLGSLHEDCLLYTSPSPRDLSTSRMPSSA